MTSQPSANSATTGRRWLAFGLIAAAVIWLLVNAPVEGRVLLVLTPDHGITVADLPSFAAIIVAGLILLSS